MVEPVYHNFTNAFLQGREAGRQIRQQKITDNALARYASGDTQGGVQDLMAVDPQTAFRLQDRDRENEQYGLRKQIGGMVAGGDLAGAQKAAATGGDFDTWDQLGKFDQAQRERARESASTLGAVGIRLLETPYEQRKAALMQMRQEFVARGYPADRVDAIIADPSDAVLNGIIGQAMTIKDALDAQNDKATLEERIRHNKEAEGGIKVLGNGAVAYDQGTGEVVARNPKTFAPPRPGAGGNNKVPPPGFVLD